MYLPYIFCLVGHLVVLASALCYAPDGSLSPGDGYVPCVSTINVDSMCCVLNVTALQLIGETAASADACQQNGLCMNNGQYSRNYCTDKTWNSPNCLKVCAGGNDGGTANAYFPVTHCTDGSWCCGASNMTSCCNVNLGFQLPASIPPYAAVSTSTIHSTADSSSGTMSSATGTSTSSPSPSTTNSIAAATVTPTSSSIPSATATTNTLGIGLGVALGVVVLIAAAVGFVLYKRKRGRQPTMEEEKAIRQGSGGSSSETKSLHPKAQDHVIYEVPASTRAPAELYA